jgi:hypothetical protein
VAVAGSDNIFDELPDDDELAFLFLEEKAREKLDEKMSRADDQSPFSQFYLSYMNEVIAAAHELNIDECSRWGCPRWSPSSFDTRKLCEISLLIAKYKMQIGIRNARRARRYSVHLDAITKQKVKFHLDQLKELAGKLELPIAKREAILGKILALEMEMARERTRFEVIAAFFLESATVVGEVGERLEPWRKWVDSIANITNLFGIAKEKDVHNPSLPLPEERKRLEPPKQQLPGPIDDDIPF